MERTQVPNTYQLGEVCQIIVKDNLELRGKGGCWAIVSAVNEFSCTVRMWDGEYAIGLQHLKSYIVRSVDHILKTDFKLSALARTLAMKALAVQTAKSGGAQHSLTNINC